MTLNKLASLIAKREGKKSEVRIGDIREILRIIVDLEAEYLMEETDKSPIVALNDAADLRAIKREKSRGKKVRNTEEI